MGLRELLSSWPVVRQVRDRDPLARGRSAQSSASVEQRSRTAEVERVVQSICPYCAVGCGQRVHVRDEEIVAIDGDPDSPISGGKLCPKGAASHSLVTNPNRLAKVRYRAPHATEWSDLPLDTALDMIADRVIATRRRTWQYTDGDRRSLRRTMGLASLGGATLDNEENYLIKKLWTALGAIQIENQARI